MNKSQQFWLDWKTKQIYLNKVVFCSWNEVEKIKGIINCSHWDWSLILLEEQEKQLIADQEKRIIKVGDGQRVINEVWDGSLEKPWGGGGEARNLLLKLVPEFTISHPSTQKDFAEAVQKWKWGQRWDQRKSADLAWNIDHRRFFANIMRDYPLPCGKPYHLKGHKEIEEQLNQGKKGFVKFYLEGYAKIKGNQIPFIPDYEAVIKGHKSLGTNIEVCTKLKKVKKEC